MAHETAPVHLTRGGGEQFAPAYRRMNPQSLVPVLEDSGLALTQSLAIIEYLEDVFDGPKLRPSDPYLTGLMRRWIYDTEEIAHANVNMLSYNARHKVRWHWVKGHAGNDGNERVDRLANEAIDALLGEAP